MSKIDRVGALSGAAWSLLTWLLEYTFAMPTSGQTVVLVPTCVLIGLGVTRAICGIPRPPIVGRALVAGAVVYASSIGYGLAAAVEGAIGGNIPLNDGSVSDYLHSIVMVTLAYPVGISMTGLVFLLWPAAWLNCALVWRLVSEGAARPTGDRLVP